MLRETIPELSTVLQKQAAIESAQALQQLAGLTPEFKLDNYRDALRKRYATLPFENLDATGIYYKNAIELRRVFVPQSIRECQEYAPQLLELPKDHLSRLRQRGEWDDTWIELTKEIIEERRRAFFDQSPRPAPEAVDDPRFERLVILGDPGSGKSSLLQYMALQWAEIDDPTAREVASLPVLIELREYDHWECDSGKSFVRYLNDAQNWHRLNQVALHDRLNNSGKVVLLLDGLDEIFEPDRRTLSLNDIQRFTDEYPNVKVIVTSRVIGYEMSQRRMTDLGFTHFMLQDLEDNQIEEFLERWHAVPIIELRERHKKQEQLARAIHESRAIRELAGNPLLLTMMAILNQHRELPRDRVHLYQRTAELLLNDWKTELLNESYPQLKNEGIGYQEKAAMLRNVAPFMQTTLEGNRGNIITREPLERILREYLKEERDIQQPHGLARALVEQLRGRNFILCDMGDDNYAFVHRTLLEYFCASALVRQSLREESSLEFLKGKVFGHHWQDESWHEILRLIAGMDDQVPVERVAAIIDFLLKQEDSDFLFRHVFLAADCCREVLNPKLLGDIRQRLADSLENILEFSFSSSDLSPEDNLRRDLDIHVRALKLLMSGGIINDPSAWLKDRAPYLDSWISRVTAVRLLAQSRIEDSSTLLYLKHCAKNDDYSFARFAAVQELARGWKDDPDTLTLLKDRVAKDDDPDVRQAAVQELLRGWKDDPEVVEILKRWEEEEEERTKQEESDLELEDMEDIDEDD